MWSSMSKDLGHRNMCAATVLDTALGQASDAESAYARVDVGEAPESLTFLEVERQMIQVRVPLARCPKF